MPVLTLDRTPHETLFVHLTRDRKKDTWRVRACLDSMGSSKKLTPEERGVLFRRADDGEDERGL